MSHRVWTATFLSATGTAIAMELVAAARKSETTAPLCYYIVKHVPQPIALGAVAVFCGWFPGHLRKAYKKAGKA